MTGYVIIRLTLLFVYVSLQTIPPSLYSVPTGVPSAVSKGADV